MNDPNYAVVLNWLQMSPLRFCPQQAKVPWIKLMHEQMIGALLSKALRVLGRHFGPSHTGSPSGDVGG